MLEIRQTGLNKAVATTEKMSNKLTKVIDATMDEAARRAEAYATGYCPKDTGELVESIYSHIESKGFVVGASAKHAVFNEYGSITTPIGSVESPVAAKKTGVRPFIRPAIYQVKKEMPEIFGKKMHEIVLHG